MTEEILDTSICKNDGLKRGMKLIVYDDQNPEEDLLVIGEAKVREVLEKYSQAKPLGKWKFSNPKNNSTNWLVITR